MTDGRITCVGCGKGIGSRAFVMDDNGETGCPACFTEDGSGECWNLRDPCLEILVANAKRKPGEPVKTMPIRLSGA